MDNIVIGVEGQVSAGKTSACKELIKLIDNCIFIDGGSIARAIVLAIANSNYDFQKNGDVSNIDPFELMKNNRKITEDEIETTQNAMNVSKLISQGDSKAFYEYAGKIIDYYRKQYNVVVTARNLVNIYPDMTYHVYVTADINERVERRYKQYNGKYSKEEIKEMILKRDKIHEKAGFNKKFERSIDVDITECKNAKESAKKIFNKLTSN